MKMSYFQSILLAGLLGCCSGTRADAQQASPARASFLPVQTGVEVKDVKGRVEYAYEGTGWRVLTVGKQLRAGATVRAAAGSSAILRVDHRSSLFRITPFARLHITAAAPPEEATVALFAATSL